MILRPICLSLLALTAAIPVLSNAGTTETDVCIYGGTAGGVAAAVQSARMGKTVVLAESGEHIGGLTSGGLGATDIGNKAAIGGISREFYGRVARHYAKPESWIHETRDDYFKTRARRTTMAETSGPEGTMWTFEPHVAEQILLDMLQEAKVPVRLQQRLASVQKTGNRITEITMENGDVFRARMFIDATYEGDLMARAGVSYTVGRESDAQYGETLNGVRAETPLHQFSVPVDPYVKPGDPSSGLLPFIQTDTLGEPGAGDRCVQAYNFRLCYTRNPANRMPHKQPEDYDPAKFELLARYLEALAAAGKKPELSDFWIVSWMPNGKTDLNNRGAFSTDYIGANHSYPDADYATRAKIWKEHESYTRGLVYFLATSPRVPANIREEMQTWGPARDEFTDTDNWPRQLYVREARRMVSDCVMKEQHCRGLIKVEDPVGLAAYQMDSHNCRRIVRDGRAENEGDVEVGGFAPYPISYRSIVPRAAECENLLVPVCLSATHIAYGSIRMEPVFMILGQSAATAAALAIDAKAPLRTIGYDKLKARLIQDKQVLAWIAPAAPARPPLKGIVVDDAQATRKGFWQRSSLSAGARAGDGYVHDSNTAKGTASLTFTPELKAGEYEIIVVFPQNPNRATNVPVIVEIRDGNGPAKQSRLTVNQRTGPGNGFASLGKFKLPAGTNTSVTISNEGTDGFVVADAVQFVPVR